MRSLCAAAGSASDTIGGGDGSATAAVAGTHVDGGDGDAASRDDGTDTGRRLLALVSRSLHSLHSELSSAPACVHRMRK